MIRVIIVFVGLSMIWVLFFSNFSKQKKAFISVIAAILCITGIWYESNASKPSANLINISQIESCGVQTKNSYRTNYDINLCIRNTAANAKIMRIEFSVIASSCEGQDQCQELQRVRRELAVEIAPSSEAQITQNLNFSLVQDASDVVWSFETHKVKALNE